MLSLLTINWNPDPELFNFFGISIRYYGLLWIIGLAFAYLIVQHQYRDRKIDEKKFEPLFFYCFFGILIGARLGHCIFYDWAYYQDHFVEMILPIKQTAAGWKMTGYTGLASHGGTLGLIIALWMYCRKTKMHYMDVLDMIAVATPITACCIRLANLMNSEIIGKPTDMPGHSSLNGKTCCPAIRHSSTKPSLLHLLFRDGLAIQTRAEKTRNQARNRLQHHQAEINRRASRGFPTLSPRFLLRPLPDGNLPLPFLHRVPERKPGEL